MDTSKLITVVIWATIALVAYEAFKGVFGATSSTTGNLADINSLPTTLSGSNLLSNAGVLGLPTGEDGTSAPYLAVGQTVANNDDGFGIGD